MKMKIFTILTLVSICILSACSGTDATASTQAAQQDTSIRQALPNTEYLVEDASTGKAQLQDGVFEEPAAPDSAAMTRIELGGIQAFGDVNGDSSEDAAVTLVVDPGGSGTFTYLALVINEAGTAKPLPAVLLGDRIIVESMEIQPGVVVAHILTRAPDEPMSAEPKVKAALTFEVQGDTLVEVK